ncbi:MAG: hypothetical protein EOO48_13515 [Flavobacterium sp.]|nr:MAG: hypothetical protein EOO48_13515 [Flavobacterium sp.]
MELIETHKCQNVLKKEHGATSMLLDFKTAQFRTAFITDLNLSLPMYSGLGRRLIETRPE